METVRANASTIQSIFRCALVARFARAPLPKNVTAPHRTVAPIRPHHGTIYGPVLPSNPQNATIGKVLVEVGRSKPPFDAENRKPQGLPFRTSLVRNESLCSALLRKTVRNGSFKPRCIPINSSRAWTADSSSPLPPASRSSTPKRVSRTSRAVAPTAEQPARLQRAEGGGGGPRYNGGGQREMFRTTCSSCGGTAEVPFQPRGDKPVYCRDCFQNQRSSY